MTSGQARFPIAPSIFDFEQVGKSGAWISELLPYTKKIVDDIAIVKSMWTEAINHDPAATLFQTGSVLPGRPSMGAWVSYGLGSGNANLPAFVALTSNGRAKAGQPLYDRLWGAGFLPGRFQGVKFRSQGDPILDLYNPAGVTRDQRRRMLDALDKLNSDQAGRFNDPAIATRIAQYELAFRMQMSVPELIDVQREPQHILDQYGPDSTKVGKYAYNCLLARRLVEAGTRVVEVVWPKVANSDNHSWDVHQGLEKRMKTQSAPMLDQGLSGLLTDMDERGLRGAMEPYAALLAERLKASHGAVWGLSETGASGPSGNRYGDPAGHTALAISGPYCGTRIFQTGSGDRVANMWAFAVAAFSLLAEALESSE